MGSGLIRCELFQGRDFEPRKVSNILKTEKFCFKYDVSPDEAKKLKTWQWPDHWLYDHFKKLLVKKIRAFGEDRMKEKVSELRRLQR